MAGRPKFRADRKLLDFATPQLAREIFDGIAAGQSLARIASHIDVCKSALEDWLDDPGRAETYKRARERAARHLATETIEIADGPANTSAPDAPPESDVARDKLRIQSRQWLASRWDRETYGESKQAAVTVNLNTLHLDALRQFHAGRQPQVATETKCIACGICGSDNCTCNR